MTSAAVLPLSFCPSMHERQLPARTAPVVPVGWAKDAAPAGRQEPRKRVGRRAGTQKCGANLAGSAECFG